MNQTPPREAGAQQSANEIFAAAVEEKVERKRVSVENAKKQAPIKREWIVFVCLAISVPVLVAIVAINVFGFSPASLFETPPSPAVAREEAQRTLDMVVADIEAFRSDYNELPESLVEIGVPPKGSWTYTIAGSAYRVQGSMYGQNVSFDSASGGARVAKEREP